MAITGIDTIDGKQIIAAGAQSATNAYKAELTTGGNSIQGLYDFVSTSSGSWSGSEYSAGTGIDITDDVISVTSEYVPFLTITNNKNTSQVTCGDLKALAYGTKKFNLYYRTETGDFYYVSRAKRVGSHFELIFSTPNTNQQYETNDLQYCKYRQYITMFIFEDEPDDKVIWVGGGADFITVNVQPNWNETNTQSESYIQNKPDIPTVQLNEDNQVSSINNYPLAGGGSLPASADEACQVVTANSADWNEVSAKLAVSSTDNSNIQYNDNKLYVKAVSSYGIDVLGTGHMNGTIVYDEPFRLQMPHYFRSTYGMSGPTIGFSAFNENDVLLFTASFNTINNDYKLSTANMTYVGPGGNIYYSPIKYFSLSCSNTGYDDKIISAYKIIPATGYSSTDEFALAKNVIRTDGMSGYDIYFKDGQFIIDSPQSFAILSNYSVSFTDPMRQTKGWIGSGNLNLGYSTAINDYKFRVDASDYSSENIIRLKNIFTANTGGLTANGITAGPDKDFAIQGQGESLKASYGAGFTFSSQNTGFGTAQLTVNYYTSPTVQTPSPKFEARNPSGAGFSIEASAAKGYDHNGNVVWDTTKAPAPEQLIGGADSTRPSILLSPYMPRSMSAQFSNAPLLSADGNGIFIGNTGQSLLAQMAGITSKNGVIRAENRDSSGNVTGYSYLTGYDVGVYHSSAFGSANSGTWSLTGSVQKREIEGDSATSAISAIAGSAISASVDLTPYQTTADMTGYLTTATFSATSGLLNDDIQTVSAAIPVLSSLNTEGITDIQLVNELPVDPVSTVLYLIPEA